MTLHLVPGPCTTSLEWAIVAQPTGGQEWGWCLGWRHQDLSANSSWTSRGGWSESHAADRFGLTLADAIGGCSFGAAPAGAALEHHPQVQPWNKVQGTGNNPWLVIRLGLVWVGSDLGPRQKELVTYHKLFMIGDQLFLQLALEFFLLDIQSVLV